MIVFQIKNCIMEKNKGIKDRERLPDSDNTNKKLSLGGIGGRKLMVLGGNIVQMEATLEAKRQGYYVISADLHEDNPGHKVADEYCKVDIVDKEAVLREARRLNMA